MYIDRRLFRHKGFTLIELIMFIVIVSVAVVGILSVMTLTTRNSADPMIRKQAIAIAESLLEEIQLQPYTFCDPEDATASTAKSAVIDAANGCTTTIQGIGATVGQTRYTDPRYNNVGDYDGFSMNGILTLDTAPTPITGLEKYTATVAIVDGAIAGTTSLRIDVNVTSPIGETITLTGYRFQYAPRAVP